MFWLIGAESPSVLGWAFGMFCGCTVMDYHVYRVPVTLFAERVDGQIILLFLCLFIVLIKVFSNLMSLSAFQNTAFISDITALTLIFLWLWIQPKWMLPAFTLTSWCLIWCSLGYREILCQIYSSHQRTNTGVKTSMLGNRKKGDYRNEVKRISHLERTSKLEAF